MALTEPFPLIKKGPVAWGPGDLLTMVLAYSPNLWDAVSLAAPGTGETFPRVNSSVTASDKNRLGIIVDLLNKEPANTTETGVPIANVGDRCLVQIGGLAKAKFAAGTILALGSPVEQSATAGLLDVQATASPAAAYGKFWANPGTAVAGDIGLIMLTCRVTSA